MNKEIKCFEYAPDGLIFVGIAEDYDSFSFERSYSGVGQFQIVISPYSMGAKYLLNADIIAVDAGVAGLITNKTEIKNETYTISGTELKGIASKRIVYPPAGQAYLHYREAPETVVKNILTTQITSASDSRKIAGTVADDGIVSDKITYDGRFENVAEDITAIAETYGIGWYADVQGKDIVWHIYHGKDRTAGQSANNRFLIDAENAGGQIERLYHNSNCALVAGQGEGVNRSIVYVNDSVAGWNRNELYVDARDIDDNSLLPQRGTEKLAEYGTDTTLLVEPSNFLLNTYRSGYDLGDIGTYVPLNFAVRLTKITEVYENNAFSLTYDFGYDAHTLSQRLNRMAKNTTTLFAKEA